VDPNGAVINNAEAILHYPTDELEALSIAKSGSLFSLWVEDPTFSNTTGTLSFNGGVPNPGVSNAGTAISVTFHALRAGTATLSVSDAAVRANDGNGTDVLTGSSGTQIVISSVAPAIVPLPAPAQTPTTPLVPKPTPTQTNSSAFAISSLTHPDQQMWYVNPQPAFAWTLPPSVTSVQLGIDHSATAAPTVTYGATLQEKTVDALDDGTWYFRLRYKTTAGWSDTASYVVHIDATPPVIHTHEFIYDDSQQGVFIRATADDVTSGIVRYEIAIDGGTGKPVSADAIGSSSYLYPVSAAGVHRITLSAIDAAGNRASVDGSFSVPPSLQNQALFHIGSIGITLLMALLLMAGLLALSILLAIIAWIALLAERRRRHPQVPTIRKEMHRGFLKMRENMELDIQMLDRVRTKRELSQEERALYRRLVTNVTTLERHIDEMLSELS
jgi:hypothetical protein